MLILHEKFTCSGLLWPLFSSAKVNNRSSKIVVSPFPAVLTLLTLFLAVFSCFANATPKSGPSIENRLKSCDIAVVHAAAEEMFRDPQTLQEPISLFYAAIAERRTGRKEEAAFLYNAAFLRTARHALIVGGDYPQLLAIMRMTVGPMIMPDIVADPEMAKRVVRRVIDWHRSTPDPFRDRVETTISAKVKVKLAEIDASYASLLDKTPDPVRIAKAQELAAQVEQEIKSKEAIHCAPGTLDSLHTEAATERIQRHAELLTKSHPLVLSRAGGAIRSVRVIQTSLANNIPKRLTVSVAPMTGATFYAEVDAISTVTSDRKLATVKFSLECLRDSSGNQDRLKDVCQSDSKSIKPVNTWNVGLSRFDIGID